MLGILYAKDVLKSTSEIIKRAQYAFLSEEERENNELATLENIDIIMEALNTSDQITKIGPVRIMEKVYFSALIRKHDKILGAGVYYYFPSDITHVWF